MKQLVIFRHGAYEQGGLTENGKAQVVRFAEALRPHVQGRSIQVLTSPYRRAKESGAIVAELLGVVSPNTEHEVLFPVQQGAPSYAVRDEDLKKIFDLVQRQDADVVILATHEPTVEDFPPYFANMIWGQESRITERVSARNGQGIVIDLEARTGTWLPDA